MKVFKVKKSSNQKVTVDKYCGRVPKSFRKVVLSDFEVNRDYEIILTGNNAMIPLKEGQNVLADLRCDSLNFNNEWIEEYYVLFFQPLEDDAIVDYVEDWTIHLV